MPLQLAPYLPGEKSVRRKLISKSIAFLAEGGTDGGEMHEIYAISRAASEKLLLDDGSLCTLPAADGQRYFSRKAWQPRKIGEIGADALKRVLSIDQASEVRYGSHEIDAVLEHGAGDKVVMECKSGDASSTASQTNAHVELMVEISRPGLSHNYFAYCNESNHQPGPSDYWPVFFRWFLSLKTVADVSANARPIREYFQRFTFRQTGQPLLDLLPIIEHARASGLITYPTGDDASRIRALNDILIARVGCKLQIFTLRRSSRTATATRARKMADQERKECHADERWFWDQLWLWLSEQESDPSDRARGQGAG
jgi:hypothetical protein